MKTFTVKQQLLCVVCIMLFFYAIPTQAALTIESVSPSMAGLGGDMEVTIEGSGFDEDTRVSISLDSGNMSAVVGSIETVGSNSGFFVAGTTLYLANGDALQVIDVSNPEDAQCIGSLTTPLKAFRVHVEGDLAYVIGNTPVLQIIDVSNPSAPRMVSVTLLPAGVTCYTVVGETVYLTLGDTWGFMVIDASDPAEPRVAGTLRCEKYCLNYCLASDLEVVDDVAYVPLEWRGLQAIDVHDPQNPRLIGFIDVPQGSPNKISVKDGLACVATLEGMLYWVDVRNPAQTVVRGSLAVDDWQRSVHLTENDLCLAAGNAGLQIIDVSDPSQPAILGVVGLGGASAVMAADNMAFLAQQNQDEIMMIDIGRMRPFQQIASIDTDGATDIKIIGQMAYIINTFDTPGLVTGSREKGLRVIDISEPSHPEIIGMLNTQGVAEDLEIVGSTAYIADGENGLVLMDITDPTQPRQVGWVDTPCYARSITVAENRAYVADSCGLQIVDVSDPEVPRIVGWLDPPGESMVRQVAVKDRTVYLGDRTDLLVVDVSQPSSPQLLWTVELSSFSSDFLVSGNRLYISDSDQRLQIFDISNPENPVFIHSTTLPLSALGLNLVDERLYLANGIGLRVLDVSNPVNPVEIAEIENTSGTAFQVAVEDDILFIANGSTGLTVLPRPEESELVSVKSDRMLTAILPAPPAVGTYTIRVFNDSEYDELPGGLCFTEPPKPIAGDWSGTGRDCLGLYFNQTFSLDYDNDGLMDIAIPFGTRDDIPVVGDWDGDGMDDIGVFRPAERRWYLDFNLDGETDISGTIGRSGDLPVVGDWDHDGRDDIGIFRPALNRYYLDFDEDGIHDRTVSIGRRGDIPLIGDWDADGKVSIGVFRPESSRFLLDDDEDGIHEHGQYFGMSTDIPIIGDWNGDGESDMGVYRTSDNCFYLDDDFDGSADEIINYVK